MRDRNKDLDRELRGHIDLEAEETGLPPEEARYAARRAFGNTSLVKEEVRQMWGFGSLERFWQDIRYGARLMRRSPGFTVVVVLSLALGIGANTAIFSIIDAVLLKSLPVAEPARLVLLQPRGPKGEGAFSYPGFEALRDENRVFSDTFTVAPRGERWNVILRGQAELTEGQLVTGNYFSGLGVSAIAGRALTPSDDQPSAAPVAVISHAYWRRKFSLESSALGSSITVNGTPFTIVGVAPPEFFGVSVGAAIDIWIPMAPRINVADASWWLSAMARLKPGVSEKEARANMEVVVGAVRARMGINAEGRDDDHFREISIAPGGAGISALRNEFSKPLRILMGVVGLVLLIACANVANLLLSRASARRREIAIRLSVGGGRARLVRQLLTESIMLATLGGALGLLFALWSGRLLVTFLSSGHFPATLDLQLDLRMLAFTACVSLLTGILFGVAPALRATRVDPGPALKENVRNIGGTRMPLSRALIVSQVALSLLLLTGAGLFVRTLENLRGKDLGFNPESVLVMSIEPSLAGYKDARLLALYEQIWERINALPGVRAAALSRFGLIGAGFSRRNAVIPGFTPKSDAERGVAMNVVSARFFEAAGIPLLAGREFSAKDTASGPKVAVVNEKFARFYFGGENPIGKRFGFTPQQQLEIVGVVADAKFFQLRNESPRTAFTPLAQIGYGPGPGMGRMTLAVLTAVNPLSLASTIRREIASDVPVYDIRTQEQQLDATLVRERLLATLAGFFGLLALALACVGLYGVMSYAVVQRTTEIGIRRALGAQRADVMWLVLRGTALLVGVGVAIGIPAAVMTAGLIESQLFGLKATDPATLISASVILSLAAALASFIPAWRAARVDPMVALRYE